MRGILIIGLIACMLGCKKHVSLLDSTSTDVTESHGSQAINDIHPFVDLLLSTIVHDERESYNFYLLVDSTIQIDLERNEDSIVENLRTQEEKTLFDDLKHRRLNFSLDTSKLSAGSKMMLRRSTSKRNQVGYIFHSFLRNENEELAILSISVVYFNRDRTAILGGWEEIVFFKKFANDWRLYNRVRVVVY